MLLGVFILLQALDALTTAAFLHLGVAEGNPLIHLALARSAAQLGPAVPLAAAKLFAVALGIIAWRSGRRRALLAMDVMFSFAILWNSAAIWLAL